MAIREAGSVCVRDDFGHRDHEHDDDQHDRPDDNDDGSDDNDHFVNNNNHAGRNDDDVLDCHLLWVPLLPLHWRRVG